MTNPNWQKVKLDELGKVITGKTPSTKDPENFGNKYPFITIPDLKNERYITKSERYLSEKGATTMKNLKLPKESVMLSCLATVGETGITTCDSFTNQQINSIICDIDKIVPEFLYYKFLYIKPVLLGVGSGGSVYTNISKNKFSNIEIDIPDIKEQHRIASILSAFDDKIELNNKINKTLEQMAQAIFKEWFVEFKFPGNEKVNMVGSKSGNIPEGWKNLKLREYVKYVRGRSYTSKQIAGNNGFAFINLKSIQEGGGYRYDGIKNYDGPVNENQYLNPDDIIVGITETTQKRAIIGHIARIPNIDLGKTTFSCDIVKLESKDLNNLYLYSLLRYGNFSEITKEKANGTNVLHLNPEDILEYEFIKPTNDIIQNFVSKIDTVYKKMDQIYLENQILSSLRDTLLPKLMSGEVKVKV